MLDDIPDDCVLALFRFLDMNDLDVMCCVSKRMHELALFQLSRNGKNEAVELAIAENQSGHAFQLFQVFNGVDYFYSLKNSESTTCKDPTCLYCDHPKKETKTEMMMQCGDDKSADLFHELISRNRYVAAKHEAIPPQMYSRLNKLLRRHSFCGLNLKNIRFDSSFMNVIEKSTNELNWIKIDDARIKNDCIDRLFSFIQKAKPRSLEISNTWSEIYKHFNESFLKNFCEDNCFKNDYELVVNFAYDYHRRYLFDVGESTIDIISRYSTIYLTTLTIPSHWLPKIFEKRLKTPRSGFMTIGITGDVLDHHFDAYPHLTVMHTIEEDLLSTTVEDRQSGTRVEFSLYDYELGTILVSEYCIIR